MKADTSARRREIRGLLSSEAIANQGQLQSLLNEKGFEVTQATISRDLDAVGAGRIKENGSYVYRLVQPGADDTAFLAMREAIDEFVESLLTSGNLIVMKVPPGAAQLVASRIDGAGLDGVLGTIAGDDTILVVADEAVGSNKISKRITGTE
ncbi:MAG: arginine repressor [Actinomycetota bacterium]